MHKVTILAGAVVALVAAGCSATGDNAPDLVIADGAGIVVAAADGSRAERIGTLTGPSSAFQPTWSPDGAFIAWTEVFDGPGDLIITSADGTSSERLERTTRPYYMSWDPAGGRVVTLRDRDGGGILVELVTTDGTSVEIDDGAPYYFAWDPDGGRYLLHVGVDRVELVEPQGETMIVDDATGVFQAPAWGAAGRLYLRAGSTGQTLVLDDGTGPREVARVAGGAQMVAAGNRVAIQAFGGDQGNGQQVVFQQIPRIDAGAVQVFDLADGSITEVIDDAAGAFFWSPDGERLLLLEGVDFGTARWLVWEDGEITTYPEFGLEPTWITTFLPFFDQYATSMTLWSQDGSAFAYPALVDGASRIFVQGVTDAEPADIGDGSWVAWRP